MKNIIIFITFSLLISCSGLNTYLLMLKSKYSKDRCEAIFWLYNNVKNKVTQELLKEALLKDKSEVVRSLAARLMGIEGNKKYIPILKKALKDPSPLVRMEVVQSLGSLLAYDKDTLKKLGEILKNDKNKWVRLKVLKSFRYMESKKCVKFIIPALEDEEPAVRFQSLILLKYFTGKDLGPDKQKWERLLKNKKIKKG